VSRWGDPFDFVVVVEAGGPAVGADHAVVDTAGQREVVDVGVAAVGAAGFGAAPFAGVTVLVVQILGATAVTHVLDLVRDVPVRRFRPVQSQS
jgi:hypothetical protein